MEAMKGETMIGIANAPCSWGSLEFELEGESPDYGQVLNEIVETGYVGTELGDRGFNAYGPGKTLRGNLGEISNCSAHSCRYFSKIGF
jgi:hypothetical protein